MLTLPNLKRESEMFPNTPFTLSNVHGTYVQTGTCSTTFLLHSIEVISYSRA